MSPAAPYILGLIVGGAAATVAGTLMMDVSDRWAFILTRGGVAVMVGGLIFAVGRAVTA